VDENTYQKWWPIHLRASRGEGLSAEDRNFYEAELRKLQEEEKLRTDVKILHEVRKNAVRFEAEHDQLQTRRAKLELEIKALEAVLGKKSQQLQ
jgi:hypothetical protein